MRLNRAKSYPIWKKNYNQGSLKKKFISKQINVSCTRCGVLVPASASIELWMHLAGLESTREARVSLGYRLEQLLRFPRALQTSRVHS